MLSSPDWTLAARIKRETNSRNLNDEAHTATPLKQKKNPHLLQDVSYQPVLIPGPQIPTIWRGQLYIACTLNPCASLPDAKGYLLRLHETWGAVQNIDIWWGVEENRLIILIISSSQTNYYLKYGITSGKLTVDDKFLISLLQLASLWSVFSILQTLFGLANVCGTQVKWKMVFKECCFFASLQYFISPSC